MNFLRNAKQTTRHHTVDEVVKRNFITIRATATVAEAIQQVRTTAQAGNIFYLYVVDKSQRFCGVISIRALLVARDEDAIANLMSSRVVSLSQGTLIKEAYALFSRSRFLSLPVLDSDGKIQGVVDAHELVEEYSQETDELFEERSRGELFELLGVKSEDGKLSVWRSAQDRFPWLLINLIFGCFSAIVVHSLGGSLTNPVLYLAFVPVLLIVSESVGMQTTSVTIAAIHRAPSAVSLFRMLAKDSATALLVGATAGALLGSFVWLWKHSWELSVTIFATLTVGSTLVSALGNIIPIAFHRLRFDPRVAAGPVVLALADCGVLLLYLFLAQLLK